MKYESLAIEAALKAGDEIMKIYSREFSVEEKEDKSPLTQADKNAHEVIKSYLDKTGIPVLSEEGRQMDFAERSAWQEFWLVDPLDGTKEFIKKNDEFTVNIALIRSGLPVFGVIYAPALKKLFVGAEGEGAWAADDVSPSEPAASVKSRAYGIPKPRVEGPYIVVASRSHFSPETQEFVDELKLKKGAIDFASTGSSLKICLVAEGVADIYPRFGPTMEWDTAAGHAIARAAGKSVIDHHTGQEMRYNKENLLNNWFIVQ